MAGLRHWFQKRSVVEQKASDGLGLAVAIIESLEDKRFTLRGPRMRYKNQSGEEVLRFIQEDLPNNYHYSSSLTRSTDSKGTIYIRVKIEGWMGLRGQYRRPSPFDKNYTITTKVQSQ
ncbi:hypothetical protein ACFL6U_07820 [Planctomycetota bacterium]